MSFIDRTPQQASNNTADIVYSINSIPTNLKSIGDLDKRQQDIVCATSKGLVELDSDGNIQPSLAESYEVNDDGLEYVFKIRHAPLFQELPICQICNQIIWVDCLGNEQRE